MDVVVDTVFPVFGVVALGFWLAGRRALDSATLADVALLVSSPALVFSALSHTAFHPERWVVLAGGALSMMAGTAGLAALYVRRAGPQLRGLVLPATFWNAGNMGLPCAHFAFGAAGLEAAALVLVVVAMAHFSVGVWIAKGQGGLAEALRMPLLWGGVAGLACAATGYQPPRRILVPIEMLAGMAIPVMLLNLGIQLRRLRLGDLHHSAAAVAIRMGGGLAVAAAYVGLLGVGGADRQVLLLGAALPGAVANAVIAERYGASPAAVASAVVLGTLCSLLSIPALVYLVS